MNLFITKQLLECIRVQIDDVRNAVPVVYHEHYNLILPPSTMYLFHLMVPDKPAKIYAILQSMYYNKFAYSS